MSDELDAERARSDRGVKTTLTFLAAAFFIVVAARAQTPGASLPNAPAASALVWNAQAVQSNATAALTASPSAQHASAPDDNISLYTIVDLALRNSKAVRVAEAQERTARGAWKETRDAYVPNFSLGSGLGYSYGFPLGTPTIFNVTSTSLLFSFSQHDYIRSARAAWKATTLSLKNVRQQVILDGSLDYIELNKTLGQIAALNQALADSDKLLNVMNDRLQAGLESDIQMTQARLTRAQIQLRSIQMEDRANELRQHLAGLTGLDAALIQPTASSIPPLPNLDFRALLRNPEPPSVGAADATADAKMYAAWGDKRQNYRPTVQMASQYALFSTFNNYQQYYNVRNFQLNNFGIGIQAVWPLFDPLRKDRAMESKTEAVRARRQAELDRIQNNESNLALWHSLRELKAREQVAALQQQLAQDMLAATVTRMNSSAGANGAPVTPLQSERQRIDERTSYVDLQDAEFNVIKVKLNLLDAVGGIEDWVKQGPEASAGSDALHAHPMHR